jgi:hypothetical protein
MNTSTADCVDAPGGRPRRLPSSLHLLEQAADHGLGVLVLLEVDQQLGEGAAFWVSSELSDPVGSLEVGKHQDVEKLGTGSRT